MVEREGLSAPRNNEENYAVSWCGWGYESDVTPKQMVQTIPKLKQLGIHWATLDDRWFNNYGDWAPRADTFGGAAIQKLVRDFHEQGIKVQLWWLPLAVEDGKFGYGGPQNLTAEEGKQKPKPAGVGENGGAGRRERKVGDEGPPPPQGRAPFKKRYPK